jgi:predicted Zn-dependent protease
MVVIRGGGMREKGDIYQISYTIRYKMNEFYMYENGKMRPVETIPGVEGGE